MKQQPSRTIKCAVAAHCKCCDSVDAYSLHGLDRRRAPPTLDELKRMLKKWSKDQWRGKLYVAKTICWDDNKHQFLQEGCAPNYRGGLWTLTCCKHEMRAAASFKRAVKSDDRATIIFTLCSCRNAPDHRQYLVSVAKVTKSFGSMREYANHLLKQKNERLLREKLSLLPKREHGLGWHFGDCHADLNGKVKAPGNGHVHAGKKAKEDLNGKHKHLLLASDCYVIWQHPILCAKPEQKIRQARFGITVTPDNLDELFVKARKGG